MKKRYFHAILFILIILAVAFAGQFIGQKIMHNKMQPNYASSSEWHDILHSKLDLSSEQDAKMSDLEKEYSQNKIKLKKQMHMANMLLADALKEDKSYSPRVQKAVDEIHQAMGEMQKQTIKHLLSIRPILTQQQNDKLEQLITDALYENKEYQHQ